MTDGIQRVGDWQQAEAIVQAAPDELKMAIGRALKAEGEFLAGKMAQRIRTGPFEPLSPLTLALRKVGTKKQPPARGTKTLNVSGDLKNSITSYPAEPVDEVFIGILKTSQSKSGDKLVNIGDIHEHGRTYVLKVTPKMLRFLFGVVFKKAGIYGPHPSSGHKGVIVIRIPARPFVKPTFDEQTPKTPERFSRHLVRLLKGKLGT